MKRFLPTRWMRNLVAFFRRDIFRSFFAHEDYRVRSIAYGGAALIALTVCGDAYLLSLLTEQMNKVITAQKASAAQFDVEFWKTFYMLLGFAAIEYTRLLVNQFFSLSWRQEATCFFLENLHLVPLDVDGVSQRIAEAVKAFTTQVLDICIPVVRAVILVLIFMPMLWELSSFFVLDFLPRGVLVYFVFVYCLMQTGVSLWWGKRLIPLQEHSQAMESDLRTPLELIQNRRNNIDGKITQRRARGIQRHVRGPLRAVNLKIIWGSAHLNGWKLIHVQLFGASLPILMYLAKAGCVIADFGTLVQIAGALTATHGSVAIVSEIMTKCTEAGGSLRRLDELESREMPYEQMFESAAE